MLIQHYPSMQMGLSCAQKINVTLELPPSPKMVNESEYDQLARSVSSNQPASANSDTGLDVKPKQV